MVLSPQQNTSSLWSINEPFHIRLLHGSRVNAAEGMKVGVVWCQFGVFMQRNESQALLPGSKRKIRVHGLHVHGRESHGPDHVSLNSPRRLVEASKQEVGRAYLIFECCRQAQVLRKQTQFKVKFTQLSLAARLFFFKCMPVVHYYYKSLNVDVEKIPKKPDQI